MRRFFKIAGGMALVLVIGTGLASAQTLSEPIGANVDSAARNVLPTSPFTCTDATQCLMYQRVYGDLDPGLVNADPSSDGYPNYAGVAGRWVGDPWLTANFAGINNGVTQNCNNWYSVWTAALNPGGVDYQAFYSSQATIINNNEDGNANLPDCSGTAQAIACMGEVRAGSNNNTGGASYPNAPFGAVSGYNGLEPVPIPEVANTADSAILALSWPAVAMVNLINRASTNPASVCPAGTPDDFLGAAAPVANPIWGVRLFAYGGAQRSLLSLEDASATAVGGMDVLSRAGDGGLACPGATCTNVFQIPCGAVTGGTCVGDDFAADGAQAIQVSEAAVAAAGVSTTGPVTFVTKVVFRGAVAGSVANPGGTGNVNPSLVSLFGGNSQQAGFSGLISSVALDARAGRGPFVELTATTTGEVLSMNLFRSENGIDFEPIGSIDVVPGQNEYTFNDRIRGRGQAQLTYKLIYETPTGQAQTFATFTGPGQDRGR